MNQLDRQSTSAFMKSYIIHIYDDSSRLIRSRQVNLQRLGKRTLQGAAENITEFFQPQGAVRWEVHTLPENGTGKKIMSGGLRLTAGLLETICLGSLS